MSHAASGAERYRDPFAWDREMTKLAGIPELEDIDLLIDAFERGRCRQPKEHNVFMHIGWADFLVDMGENTLGLSRELVERRVAAFKTEIAQVVRNLLLQGGKPIFCTYEGEVPNSTKCLYQEGPCIPTLTTLISIEEAMATGFLGRDGLRKLFQETEGINEKDRFVVHGAELDTCVTHAAFQLAMSHFSLSVTVKSPAFFSKGVAEHDWVQQYERLMMSMLASFVNPYKTAGISFGTVLSTSSRPYLGGFGSHYTAPLFTSHTKIHRLTS